MDLQSNPPKMYKNFDELIAEGERSFVNVPNVKVPENKILVSQEENVNQ